MKWLIGLLLIVALGVFVLVVQANAHDPARPDLDKWFSDLASGRGLCCSNNDGIFEPEWESKDGHYRVKLKGEWIDVPDDAVIKGPNLDGRTVVWPMQVPLSAYQYSKGGKPAIRCFMPGTMT
jgi:hypothetical protein